MEYAAQLISPHNGRPLRPASAHLLTDGELLWPVVDGIAYLRPKHDLRKQVVAALWLENVAVARRLLLADQDRFSPTAPPDQAALDELLDPQNTHSLREAMQLLQYGPVGDYFAYRWCTPTFLSGLTLLGQMAELQQPVVEFACGIGHFLRALEQRDIRTVGVDIVFSKLWLARRYMEVEGPLVCGDIEAGPVLSTDQARTVFCHDAFYFFEQKEAAIRHMRAVAGAGNLAVGHVHTHLDAHEAGFSASLEAYHRLTDSTLHDDTDAVRQWYAGGHTLAEARPDSPAIGWVEGRTNSTRIDWSAGAARLRLNPLLDTTDLRYPSEGWRREYEADHTGLEAYQLGKLLRRNPLVRALCEGHLVPEELETADRRALYRQRVLVDLPARW